MTEFLFGVGVAAFTILCVIVALAIAAEHVIRCIFNWGYDDDRP